LKNNDVHPKPLLLVKIIMRKRKMYRKAKTLGYTHPSVIKCSQELDYLLNKYQGIKTSA